MSHRRQLSWATALRDLNQDRANRPEVREERLRTTAGLRGSPALALSAWRARNAKRYVVGVFSISAVAADDLAGPNLVVAARRDALRYERHQALFEKYQELGHARLEAETLRKKMIPKAEQAIAFTRRGFAEGRFSFIALAQAQKTLFELRERSTEAVARYHTLLVEVERLTAAAQDTTP